MDLLLHSEESQAWTDQPQIANQWWWWWRRGTWRWIPPLSSQLIIYDTINWFLYIYICTYLKVPRTIEAIPQLMIIWILSFLFVSKRCGSWNPMGFWTSKFCKTLRLQDFITDENQEFEHRISAAASETRSFGNPVIRRSWCFTKKTHRKMRHFWPWRSF